MNQAKIELKKYKGCSVWDLFLSLFTKACSKAAAVKAKFLKKNRRFESRLRLFTKLQTDMKYFKGLTKISQDLQKETIGLLGLTREFRQALSNAQNELKNDFTDENIEDELGDVDFMNEFAETLWAAFNKLSVFCDKVVRDCKLRKGRLDDALIFGKKKKEEEEAMTQLAASTQGKMMDKFYHDLASGCNKWYTGASRKFASDVELFTPYIKDIGNHKYLLMKYS